MHRATDNYSRNELEQKISDYAFPTDSILKIHAQSEKDKNDINIVITCKILGQRYRENSDFSKAIAFHQQGLNAALRLKDTLNITQLLNHLGTDFRRVGAFPEATDYHFQALYMAELYSQNDQFVGRKNKVMALNGIGNVYLSLNNYNEAEQYFRQALDEEKALGSALGQAINYANIGAVFQAKNQNDSAMLYYGYSMAQNIKAKSQLGVGLCHIHFGEIYEQQKEYDKAENEYRAAYDIMENISDTWHWLGACLSLGRINLLKNNTRDAQKYIVLAKTEAEKINSPEQLAQAYNLMYQLYEHQRNYSGALDMFKRSKMYQDSVQNLSKINQALDMRVNYEREKSTLRIEQLNAQNLVQKHEKRIIIIASVVTIVLMIMFLAALAYAYVLRTRRNKILRNLDKMRSDFFTNVTHEFRTPLTIILGLSSHIRKQKASMNSESLSYLNAIERQGNNLLQLVNRMLNMAKMEAGIEDPEWKNGNISAYLQMVVEAYQLYAREKNINLSFYADEQVLDIDFVPHYVDEIIQNLLSNAIKYTPAGGKISLSVAARKNKEAVIKVTDTGKGISEEDLARIFEPFYQCSDLDANIGSGIGLHYAKQLAERMHGKIFAESKVGEGSVFTLILPVKQQVETVFPVLKMDEIFKSFQFAKTKELQELDRMLEKQEELPDADMATTILLVEDNNDVVLYIKALLPVGYRLVHAKDGQQGMDMAQELVPDLIITDVMMPLKDGFSLCRDIKSSELLNHIPVIILTAKTATEDQLTGLECGADAFLKKPFNPDELLIRIQKLLESRRLLKEKYLRSVLKGEKKMEKDVNLDFLQRVTDIVYREMQNSDFSPSLLADKLCLSLSQLNRKMTAVSGYNPSSYILKMRINKAKKKLAQEDIPISEVADQCGFYDLAYFSRTFKKQTGFTPSQYRRRPA
ncbi:MAG: response regulator [Petrimonas sp.]|nr:response regulator [Petrimonas sp.]